MLEIDLLENKGVEQAYFADQLSRDVRQRGAEQLPICDPGQEKVDRAQEGKHRRGMEAAEDRRTHQEQQLHNHQASNPQH